MRSVILLILSNVFSLVTFSQVGIGTNTPATSAILDVKSTNKGFLPPRLSTEQIKLIEAPEAGLMVYNTVASKPCFYNGTRWVYFDTSYVLPELGKYWNEGGGIVVALDETGVHGLIAATVDQSSSTSYGCSGTNMPNAQYTAVGTGQSNTNAILAACGTAGIAARLCDNLVLNGKSDWYLPSKDEMLIMYGQAQNLPGINLTLYISSSQISSTTVWMQNFAGGQYQISQSSLRYVRAMRSF